MTERSSWMLLRRLGRQESLFFPIVVEIEEDEPALFGATVLGLETSLIAMGRSPEEAEQNALALFKDRVDFTIHEKRPICEGLSNSIAFKKLNFDLEKAAKLLDEFLASVEQASIEDEWHLTPLAA